MEHAGHLPGTGVLDWMKKERTTHRYGTVCLYRGTAQGGVEDEPLSLPDRYEGQHGQLNAVVRGAHLLTRTALDLLRDAEAPNEPPAVGSRHALGFGTLFKDGAEAVGLYPCDGRATSGSIRRPSTRWEARRSTSSSCPAASRRRGGDR